MKKLLAVLLLAVSVSAQTPQVPLTGNIGSGGVFPLLNSGVLIFTSDADHVMSYPETSFFFIRVTSSVGLSTSRNIVAPLANGFTFLIQNATTGGQAIQIIGTTGSGATIPNGQTALVACDGANYVISGSSPGGINQLTGDGGAGPGTGSQAFTLATVNGAPGSYGDSAHTLSATVNQKGLITSLSNVAIPTASPGANGLGSPDNSTIQVSGGVYTVPNTTINGVPCTPGGSCSVTSSTVGSPHDETGVRSFNSVFQNLTGNSMWVTGWATTSGSSTASLIEETGPTSISMVFITGNDFTATISSGKAGFGFWVPAGYFYEITTSGAISGLGRWIEYF